MTQLDKSLLWKHEELNSGTHRKAKQLEKKAGDTSLSAMTPSSAMSPEMNSKASKADQCLIQPSSEKLPLVADGNKYRDPQPDITHRVAYTALSEMSTSNLFPSSSGNSTEEEGERV
ncbi:hypothetical protein STEG23_007437 [Scotinomys teguina]